MEATLFGPAEGRLFGLYHPASGSHRRGRGVVICPPIAHEHMRTHRTLRNLAMRLAKAGFDVLRFDYYGVGDSSGESEQASVKRWQMDVGFAADELRALSGVESMAMVGVRLGAALAATASQAGPVEHLVFWDPIVGGSEYITTLQAEHQAMLVDRRCFLWPRSERAGDGLLGFPFPRSLRVEIAELDLLSLTHWPSERLTVVCSSQNLVGVRLVDKLRMRGHEASLRFSTTMVSWDDREAVGRTLTGGDVPTLIEEALLSETES